MGQWGTPLAVNYLISMKYCRTIFTQKENFWARGIHTMPVRPPLIVVSKLHLDESPEHRTMKWLTIMDVMAATAPEIIVLIHAKPITAPSPKRYHENHNTTNSYLLYIGNYCCSWGKKCPFYVFNSMGGQISIKSMQSLRKYYHNLGHSLPFSKIHDVYYHNPSLL